MEKVGIEKLKGSNCGAWSFKMKLLLIQKGSWTVVSGQVTSGETFDAEDQKALAAIGLGICDEQIVHIQDCKTSKEAWDCLSKVYETQELPTKCTCKRN